MAGWKFSTIVALAGCVMLVPNAASAASGAEPAPNAQSPIKNDTGKRICREVTPTGTRFAKRVCRTAAEWQKSTDDAQRHLEESDMSRREFQPDCGVGCPH